METEEVQETTETAGQEPGEPSIDQLLDELQENIIANDERLAEEEESAPSETAQEAQTEQSSSEPAPLSSDEIIARAQASREQFEQKRAYHQERRELERQRKELERQQQEATTQNANFMDQFRKDPAAVINQSGVSPEQVAASLLDGAKPKEEKVPDIVLKRLQALEQQNQMLLQQQQQREVANTRQQYLANVQTSLTDEKYTLLRSNPNAANTALSIAVKYAQDTGQVLPISEVLDTLQEQWREHVVSLGANEAARKVLGLSGQSVPQARSQEQREPTPRELSSAPREPIPPEEEDLSDAAALRRGTHFFNQVDWPDLEE